MTGVEMNKVKSAIITALLTAAIVVLAFFALIPWSYNNGINTFDSFIQYIHLGSEFTGDAYVMLYPEGVISTAAYEQVANDAEDRDSEEYKRKYQPCGGAYVEKEKLGYVYDSNKEDYVAPATGEVKQAFLDSIANDAAIISKRFAEKGYTSYSVALEDDGFAIKVTVPTNYTYAEYKNAEADLTQVSNTIQFFTYQGKLTLRDKEDYKGSKSILSSTYDDASSVFKSISVYSVAGNYSIKMHFTDEGYKALDGYINSGSSDDSSQGNTVYVYVGETNVNLNITPDLFSGVSRNTLYVGFQNADVAKTYAEDYAILLSSAQKGNILTNKYNEGSANLDGVIALTPSFGKNAAIYLFVAMLLAIVAVIALSIVKYKKLGIVNALMVLVYSLAMITALMLLEIQVTTAGAFTILLGLALLTFTNFRVFEAVRKETELGRTIQASVKTGYKKTLATILDMHILLIAASIILAFASVGELAACGFIFFIASVASYVLYWFTRFMWYVISAPVKDKFKFCGYKMEVYDDEDKYQVFRQNALIYRNFLRNSGSWSCSGFNLSIRRKRVFQLRRGLGRL